MGLFHRTAMQEKHAADKHLFSFKWITWHLFAALWDKPLCWFAELKWVSEVFAKSSCSSQLKRKPVRATLANTPSNTTLSLTTCFIKKSAAVLLPLLRWQVLSKKELRPGAADRMANCVWAAGMLHAAVWVNPCSSRCSSSRRTEAAATHTNNLLLAVSVLSFHAPVMQTQRQQNGYPSPSHSPVWA